MERRRSRPGLYIAVAVCALLAGVPLHLRTQGLFACPATGYGTDAFVADCNASAYGDYDHGAFWFGLEPHAARAAAAADVLFLGSSRLQFGLSTPAVSEWFAGAAASRFLFGFSDTETVVFTAPMLERLQARPKAVVINADRFFDDRVSRPAQEIVAGDVRIEWRYRIKRRWQAWHRELCGSWSPLCGRGTVVYRSRVDGSWQLLGTPIDRPMPVSDRAEGDRERWSEFGALAHRFVSTLPVPRECVLLTIVPTVETRRAEAQAIAAAAGVVLVAPDVPGLQTFDGSHLDAASAERWSLAFLDAAGPRLRDCLRR